MKMIDMAIAQLATQTVSKKKKAKSKAKDKSQNLNIPSTKESENEQKSKGKQIPSLSSKNATNEKSRREKCKVYECHERS